MARALRLPSILLLLCLCAPHRARPPPEPPRRPARRRGAAAAAAPQGGAVCSRDAGDPVIARFCAWLEDDCQATGTSNVYFAFFEHEGVPARGLGLVSDIRRGGDVFCLPPRCWLDNATLEPTATSPPCSGLRGAALAVAEEQLRGAESFFQPYFLTLPTEEDYRRFHPAYLDGSIRLHPSVDRWGRWLRRLEGCHARRRLPTWRQLKLAYVQLISRGFRDFGMLPLADMVNHGAEGDDNVYERENGRGELCFTAARDLTAGTELLYRYGNYSPMVMLARYGFVVPRREAAARQHGQRREEGCAGLRPEDLRLLPNETGLVWQNYAAFARRFCSGEGRRSGGGGGGATATPVRRDL